MDLHVCVKIDDDAVNKIAKVITETVRKVTEIQQTGAGAQPAAQQPVQGGAVPAASQTIPYSAQTAQATQMPAGIITGQSTTVQTPAPQTITTPVKPPASQSVTVPQPAVTMQQTAVPVAARTYTLDELASAAMLLMDRGMQVQLQDLLAGYGVESLPALPPEQYGNFATALRGMGAQI